MILLKENTANFTRTVLAFLRFCSHSFGKNKTTAKKAVPADEDNLLQKKKKKHLFSEVPC